MKNLMDKYLDPNESLRILDCGSMNVQVGEYGTYKDLCSPNWTYVGLDIEAGANVDLVVEPYGTMGIEEFGCVISGQALEHVEYPWLLMERIAEAMKSGALHFNIVPSTGPIHRHPVDCYRYFPDGMAALAKWAGLEVLEIQSRSDSIWCNTVLVARKP